MNSGTKQCPPGEDIAAFLRDEVDGAGRDVIVKHLEICSDCRAVAEGFSSVISRLRADALRSTTVVDLSGRILEQIETEARPAVVNFAEESGSYFLRAAACFALLCVSTVALWLGNQSKVDDGSSAGPVAMREKDRVTALKTTIQWLASVQKPSGGWDASSLGGREEYNLALNGLALLAFTRSTDSGAANADVITRSAGYLAHCQNESGLFGSEGDGMMYNHGIVTVALLEAYAGGRNAFLKEPLDKALSYIKKQQLSTGGWGYSSRPGNTANTSVSVWQLQALLLAGRLGWDSQKQALRNGLVWLNSMIDDKGQFGYDNPGNSPEGKITLTAMGALCMFMTPENDAPYGREMLARLKQALASSPQDENGLSDLYRSYFRAAAFRAAKTGEYSRKLSELQDTLLAAQDNSGEHAGSWNPSDKWGPVGGRIYSTSVAALTLEMECLR